MEIITKADFESNRTNFEDYVILLNIPRKYEKLKETDEANINEICKGNWRINRNKEGLEKYNIACCLNNRVIVGVLKIDRWEESEEQKRSRIVIGEITKATRERYMGKKISHEIKLGQNPVRFINKLDSEPSKTNKPEGDPINKPNAGSETTKIVSRLVKSLKKHKQLILVGPPGTSKTHIAKLIAEDLASNEECTELIQFHPNYTYENFIQGIFPKLTNGKLSYEIKKGSLLEIAKNAQENGNQKYVLIIDEINRANLQKVMGELFYSLEYRGEKNVVKLAKLSEKSSEEEGNFFMPENLYIVGTMNNADRSIADFDVALRRRFIFYSLPPNAEFIKEYYEDKEVDATQITELIEIFKTINNGLKNLFVQETKLIGHTYFMLDNITEDSSIRDLMYYQIIPLLEDYFYRDYKDINKTLKYEVYKKSENMRKIDYEEFKVGEFKSNLLGKKE